MHAPTPTLFAAILIACILVLAMVIFFTVTMLRHQRKNLSLYKEKLAAEITTLEKERTRMAEDLHDELGPILTGIKLKLNSLDGLKEKDQQMLDKVHLDMAGLINRMRDISNGLMPAVLIKKGLVTALESAVGDFNQQRELRIEFRAENVPVLSSAVSVNLYRISHEIITNTLRHAAATKLLIRLAKEDDRLVLTTTDNGKGFDHRQSSSAGRGYGLLNLHNRTEMMGGEMFVESQPGRGTTYRIVIPV